MGYFSNGCQGEDYQHTFCKNCVHSKTVDGYPTNCMVWELHLAMNYDHCNDESSPLHALIPRDGVENLQCTMFHPIPKEDPKDAEQQLHHINARLENLVEMAEDFSRQVEREAAAHLKCKAELATLKHRLEGQKE